MDATKLDKLAQVHARAWHDAEFHARLHSDPKGALKEAGLHVPDHMKVKVVEDTPDTAHFVIPARPKGLSDDDLRSGKVHADICTFLHADICTF
jgi:hypothetical protein